jgi:hypothetical protein
MPIEQITHHEGVPAKESGHPTSHRLLEDQPQFAQENQRWQFSARYSTKRIATKISRFCGCQPKMGYLARGGPVLATLHEHRADSPTLELRQDRESVDFGEISRISMEARACDSFPVFIPAHNEVLQVLPHFVLGFLEQAWIIPVGDENRDDRLHVIGRGGFEHHAVALP